MTQFTMSYSPRFSNFFVMRLVIGLCIYIPMSKGLPTQCVLVDDCDFYGWFIYKGNNVVPDSPKQTLEAFVKEEECGLDQKGNVVKGRNTINLIHF